MVDPRRAREAAGLVFQRHEQPPGRSRALASGASSASRLEARASINDGRASDELRCSDWPRVQISGRKLATTDAPTRARRGCFPANRVACGVSALPDGRSAPSSAQKGSWERSRSASLISCGAATRAWRVPSVAARTGMAGTSASRSSTSPAPARSTEARRRFRSPVRIVASSGSSRPTCSTTRAPRDQARRAPEASERPTDREHKPSTSRWRVPRRRCGRSAQGAASFQWCGRTKNATAAYWRPTATMTKAWKSSW